MTTNDTTGRERWGRRIAWGYPLMLAITIGLAFLIGFVMKERGTGAGDLGAVVSWFILFPAYLLADGILNARFVGCPLRASALPLVQGFIISQVTKDNDPLVVTQVVAVIYLLASLLVVGITRLVRSQRTPAAVDAGNASATVPPLAPGLVDPANPLQGVRGWLKFFVVVQLYVAPILFVLSTITSLIGAAVLADEYPRIFLPTTIGTVVGACLVGKWIQIALRLKSIQPGVVREVKVWLLLTLAWSIGSVPLAFLSGIEPELLLEGIARSLLTSLIGTAIWYSYFSVSKRVKATYVDSASPVSEGASRLPSLRFSAWLAGGMTVATTAFVVAAFLREPEPPDDSSVLSRTVAIPDTFRSYDRQRRDADVARADELETEEVEEFLEMPGARSARPADSDESVSETDEELPLDLGDAFGTVGTTASRLAPERTTDGSSTESQRLPSGSDRFEPQLHVRLNRDHPVAKQIALLEVSLNRAIAENVQATAARDRLEAESQIAGDRLAKALEALTEAERVIAAQRTELDRLEAMIDFARIMGIEFPDDPRKPAESITGSITAVHDSTTDLVTLDLGRDAGLAPGMMLDIVRGATYIGRCRVDSVTADSAVAAVVLLADDRVAAVDDTVMTGL